MIGLGSDKNQLLVLPVLHLPLLRLLLFHYFYPSHTGNPRSSRWKMLFLEHNITPSKKTHGHRGVSIAKVFNSRAMFAKIKKDPILCGAFGECVHSYIERGVVIKWDSSWVNCPPSILLPALFHFTTSNY